MQAKPGFNARCTLDTREEDAITDYNFGTRFGLYGTEKRSSFVEGVLSDRSLSIAATYIAGVCFNYAQVKTTCVATSYLLRFHRKLTKTLWSSNFRHIYIL